MEPAGLDYVALTDGNYESMGYNETDTPTAAHGAAKIFREALSCPLIIGGVHSHEGAAQVISAGHLRRPCRRRGDASLRDDHGLR